MKTQLFYSSYLTTYLEKDLKELVYDNYSKQVGVSTNTIKTWISVLVKTGIVYLVETYNEESIIKRVVKRPKMYFFDTGFAAYLCGIDSAQTLQKSFLKGRLFETFIFNEIRKSYMNDGQMQQLYYYRDSEQNKVDLILLKMEFFLVLKLRLCICLTQVILKALGCFKILGMKKARTLLFVKLIKFLL